MTAEPLWKRALRARGLGGRDEAALLVLGVARAQEAARRGGYGRRVHARPKVGDVFGSVRVVVDLGSGRQGRADASFEVECTVCGARGQTFEFNLRKSPRCFGKGWRNHA